MERSYFFVRHGRAVYQERGFRPADHPEGPDWPLAPIGHRQARAVAPTLASYGVERVISSGLRRARQTAAGIAEGGLPYAHAWPDLNEVEPRHLRAAPRRLRLPAPDWWSGWQMARAMRQHVRGRPPDGWRVADVERRVREVLGRLDRMGERRIAVVGHGFWILLATVALEGPLRPRWVDNCSITRVDADGRGRYRVLCFATPGAAVR